MPTMPAQFPFGQPLKKVCQTDRTPKTVFVLGVYASAVHARWTKDGKEVVKALAVASEPYIFWKGDGAEEIIRTIAIPAELGSLEPAAKMFNGPSGIALDTRILLPLGLDRTQAWLCDLVPYSCMNPSQRNALKRAQQSVAQRLDCSNPIFSVPGQLTDRNRRQEILAEIQESRATILILLGDEPIRWFLNVFDRRWQRLADFTPYGRLHPVEIEGVKLNVLPMVHPRVAAGLGKHDPLWLATHAQWIQESASSVIPADLKPPIS